jgi:hypothetical protein
MARGVYVFGYEDEPADERPTDYRTTSFGQSGLVTLSTDHASWTSSQHSTFEQPSRVGELVQERREDKKLKQRLITLGLLLFTCAVAAAVYLLARR